MTIDDIPTAARIHHDAWHSTHRGRLPEVWLERRTPEWFVNDWMKAWTNYRDHPHEFLLGELDGEPVATVRAGVPTRHFHHDRRGSGSIERLYVRPEAQGRGFGDAMLIAGESSLEAMGYEEAVLFMIEPRQSLISFYGRRGWDTDRACREHYFNQPFTVVRMVKGLSLDLALTVDAEGGLEARGLLVSSRG